MVAILCEQGHAVRIVSPRRGDIIQRPPCTGAELCLFDAADDEQAAIADRWTATEIQSLRQTFIECAGTPDLVIGVDRGIIAGALVSEAFSVPLVLLSFEIFFADEAGVAFKKDEQDACSGIALAICQDEVRGALLARENRIPSSRLRHLPVSGRGYKGGERTGYWHERCGIGADQHIALFMGSISAWSMSPYILSSASRWSGDWHLVMHHRYEADPWVQEVRSAYTGYPRIHFSDAPFDTFEAMRPALLGADVGIALYQHRPGGLHDGHNLESIGLASGKIAVYLQHGLPVVVNEIGLMSEFVRQKRLGSVIDTGREWTPAPPDSDSEAIRSFFVETLDLERTFTPVLRELDTLAARARLKSV